MAAKRNVQCIASQTFLRTNGLIKQKVVRIIIHAEVKGHFREVFRAFDEQFFRYLLPAFPKIELKQFTGSEKGDVVHLHMKVFGGQDWISDITEDECNSDECFFIDEGRTLPFPLRAWRHKHRILRMTEHTSMIRDEIEFSSGLVLFDYLLYPFLYLAFYPRKKAYTKYFEQYEK
jgi:ligand-binding SRPBCC domain-containing protein